MFLYRKEKEIIIIVYLPTTTYRKCIHSARQGPGLFLACFSVYFCELCTVTGNDCVINDNILFKALNTEL